MLSGVYRLLERPSIENSDALLQAAPCTVQRLFLAVRLRLRLVSAGNWLNVLCRGNVLTAQWRDATEEEKYAVLDMHLCSACSDTFFNEHCFLEFTAAKPKMASLVKEKALCRRSGKTRKQGNHETPSQGNGIPASTSRESDRCHLMTCSDLDHPAEPNEALW